MTNPRKTGMGRLLSWLRNRGASTSGRDPDEIDRLVDRIEANQRFRERAARQSTLSLPPEREDSVHGTAH